MPPRHGEEPSGKLRHMNPVWMTRHPVATYFALAYVISWAIGVPLALQAQGITRTHLPFALHYLTAFGPALAALAIASMIGEPLAGAAGNLCGGMEEDGP